jgi:lauroyl/myristoyl acyltransferase
MSAKAVCSRLCIQALARLPWPVGLDVLGAAGVVYGVARQRPLRLALDWAVRQPPCLQREVWRVSLSLLANASRYLGNETLLVVGHPAAIQRRFVLEGEAYLHDAARRSGVILLGFHLGPPVAPLALRIHGYRMAVAGSQDNPVGWPLRRATWGRFLEPGEDPFILVSERDARVAGLYRLRQRLLDGKIVCTMADGLGTEVARVPLPGRDLILRAGWFVLRRSTGVPTLPLLTHSEGRRIVVTIHPPLPAPHQDRGMDLAACRDALAAILQDYVRRFPGQCSSLALSRDS